MPVDTRPLAIAVMGPTASGKTAFAIELAFLNGRQRLQPRSVFSLLQYDSEAP